jgi:hypothetical protein
VGATSYFRRVAAIPQRNMASEQAYLRGNIIRLRKGGAPLGCRQSFFTRKFPMPKLPDMSASAVKSREAMTKIAKATKPKEAPPAPPKPRMAKSR